MIYHSEARTNADFRGTLDESQTQELKKLVERLPVVMNELECKKVDLQHTVEKILSGEDWGKINFNPMQRRRDRDDDLISIKSFDSLASE